MTLHTTTLLIEKKYFMKQWMQCRWQWCRRRFPFFISSRATSRSVSLAEWANDKQEWFGTTFFIFMWDGPLTIWSFFLSIFLRFFFLFLFFCFSFDHVHEQMPTTFFSINKSREKKTDEIQHDHHERMLVRAVMHRREEYQQNPKMFDQKIPTKKRTKRFIDIVHQVYRPTIPFLQWIACRSFHVLNQHTHMLTAESTNR